MTALEFVQTVAYMLGWPEVETIEGTLDKETTLIVKASDLTLSSIQGDKDWQELQTEGRLELEASTVADGTIVADYGTALIGTDTDTFVAGDVGKAIQVNSSKIAYRIVTVESGYRVVIDRPWAEDSINEEGFLYIGQDSYELPTDFDKLLVDKLYNSWVDDYVKVVGPQELAVTRQSHGLGLSIGVPKQCTIHGVNTAGTARKIHLDIAPEENYILDFTYQKKHPKLSTDDTLVYYPDKDLMYIMDMVKARLDRDAEDSQNAQTVAADAMAGRIKAQQHKESGQDPVRMSPRVSSWSRNRRR